MITGWLTPEARLDNLGTVVNTTRIEAVGGWQKISLEERMTDMFWQWGYSGYSYGRNHDDGFTIFIDEYVLLYIPVEEDSANTHIGTVPRPSNWCTSMQKRLTD